MLIDVSDSITFAEREKSRAAVLTVLQKMEPAERVDLVIFSTSPQVLARGLTPHEASAVMATTGLHTENSQHTNLEAVTVHLNGNELSSQEITLLPGRRRIPLTVQAPEFGAHVVELAISDERGVPVPHATCGGVLRVGGRARVLVVSEGRVNSPLARALTVQGMEVQEVGVGGLPESLSGFASYSAVILDNMPALYLTERQEDALQGFVSGGGGLLVVGGDSSLGRGEYYASGLEELLPVQTNTRQRLLFTRAKILYLIDQFGSMTEMVGKISKEKADLQGIAESLKELNPLDEVGILSFSDRADWVLPFTSASNLDQIRQALSHTGQGGGTDLASGLEEAVQGLSGTGPLRCHVVILTDGFTSEERLESLCRRLHGMGATITTIGVGRDVNENILRSVAQWGEGQFYRADEATLPTSGRGIQEFEIHELAGKSWTVGAVWLPPSDEYQSYGPDLGVLSYLTALTGGKILSQAETEIPASLSWEPYPLRQWLLIAALFLFVLELAYRSTSLGQGNMAKTAFAGWWERQQQVLDSLRAYDQGEELTDTSGEKTKTAYKYLAKKNRAHRNFEE